MKEQDEIAKSAEMCVIGALLIDEKALAAGGPAGHVATKVCKNFGCLKRAVGANLPRMVLSFALPVADEARLSNRKKHRAMRVAMSSATMFLTEERSRRWNYE